MGPPLLILLFGTHLFLTVRLKVIQRYLLQAMKLSLSREKEGDGDASQFGAAVITPYRILWVIAVMVGPVSTLQAVWSFSDVANGLMAVPNLVALLALNDVIVSETRKYL